MSEVTDKTLLYCATCGKHTDHVMLTDMYATACKTCGSHTSQLMRLHSQEAGDHLILNAPDGTPATIVSNDTKTITYYIDSGEYAGYYSYDKQSGTKEIRTI